MLFNTGIIIVWKTHFFFKDILEAEIKQKYEIKEEHKINVSNLYIKNLLREIHYGKKWWEQNIDIEAEKRSQNNDSIYVFIVQKENIHETFTKFKRYIREKYKLDKTYFHLSDPDCFEHLGKNCQCKSNKEEFMDETIKHINLLFHKNTVNFLNKMEYKKYKFNSYLDKYILWLKKNKLNINEFCIDNGGILAAYGLRDAHDLDFLCYNDNINTYDNDFGCENKNHRNEYLLLNYNIKDIIDNPKNHFYHFGCKFMSIKILQKFKYNRTHTIGNGQKKIRQKDINDYNLIQSLKI